MSKKAPLIILFLIVLAAVLLVVDKSKKAAPLPGVLPSYRPEQSLSPVNQGFILTNLVKYTDSGFSPSELKVSKGTKVHFVNQSFVSMWPASAMHPTHAIYPTKGGCIGSTFDACKDIKPGEEWSFVFDVVGTWKYHNHSNLNQAGMIIVE